MQMEELLNERYACREFDMQRNVPQECQPKIEMSSFLQSRNVLFVGIDSMLEF